MNHKVITAGYLASKLLDAASHQSDIAFERTLYSFKESVGNPDAELMASIVQRRREYHGVPLLNISHRSIG